MTNPPRASDFAILSGALDELDELAEKKRIFTDAARAAPRPRPPPGERGNTLDIGDWRLVVTCKLGGYMHIHGFHPPSMGAPCLGT